MKSKTLILRLTALLVVALAMTAYLRLQWTGSGTASAGPPPQAAFLKQVATIDLPGPKGKRFDYLTIDQERHRLFSTHLGAGLLYVIDLHTNKVLKTVEPVSGP